MACFSFQELFWNDPAKNYINLAINSIEDMRLYDLQRVVLRSDAFKQILLDLTGYRWREGAHVALVGAKQAASKPHDAAALLFTALAGVAGGGLVAQSGHAAEINPGIDREIDLGYGRQVNVVVAPEMAHVPAEKLA